MSRPGARIALAVAAALTLAGTGGCAGGLIGRRAEPVTKDEAPKLTDLERKVLEAREQAALAPAEPYWLHRLGQIYLDADSTAQAETALQASLHRDPGYAPALALLSRVYYQSGRHQEGATLLEAARTRASAAGGTLPPDLVAGLALHYEAMDRHDLAGALVGAKGGEARASRSASVYVTLRGDTPGAAAEMAREALDEDPRSAANQNNYGITRLRAGDPKAARSAFQRAIEIDPKLPGPYYNLAILERFYMFDEEAASRWLSEYRKRATDDPDNLFAPVAKNEPKPAAGKEQK
ncbi:MAG TPA: tetratricopeptide repeat protein [Candidatus Eisenbacteria bacterium]|nr:tetratricopeptide repeat protein [Candidatus Eisenbacteria bacterium]